jgi:pimeloyl-ACP methyl ester carboxylesterase
MYESVMAAGDAQRYSPPGQLVTVDGHTMHIRCVGQGSPTVILEQGAGGFSMQWPETIVTQLSQTTRVCAYDRAGYGWSDPRPEERTAWQIVHELHSLLEKARIEPPYVVVGVSNGGLYIRSYAAEYPQEVAGLVLAAATSVEGLEDIKGLPSTIFIVMGRLGIFRLFPEMICPGTSCDQASKPMIAAFRGRATLYQTYDAEWVGIQSPDALAVLRKRLSPAGSLGNKPLVILTSNQSGLPESEMPASYREFLANDRKVMTSLSSNNRYVLVNGGHGLYIEHPNLVIQSVKDVVEAARTAKSLPQ